MEDAAVVSLPTRERQRRETRERLYRAALAEFRRVGFAGAQVDAIVRAAGVARGTFYLHFQGKEDVLRAFRRQVEADMLERLEKLDRPASVRALLEQVTEALLRTRDDPASVRELVALALGGPADHDWGESPYFAPLTRWFDHFQTRGELRSDLSAREMTALFVTSFFGFLVGPAAPRRGRRRAITLLIEVFLGGIVADGARRRGGA